eukprot:NODE_11933_length_1257_cov_1.728319.p1 GENE.NODE_11933_length_1257_cov_1.728319~~NODE_11933_length_1257_cov_1.728319.p1  ORF type:complete len:260 (-),score=39.46 NODE_11933_length_1257_cov_1.728319:205-984(-)
MTIGCDAGDAAACRAGTTSVNPANSEDQENEGTHFKDAQESALGSDEGCHRGYDRCHRHGANNCKIGDGDYDQHQHCMATDREATVGDSIITEHPEVLAENHVREATDDAQLRPVQPPNIAEAQENLAPELIIAIGDHNSNIKGAQKSALDLGVMRHQRPGRCCHHEDDGSKIEYPHALQVLKTGRDFYAESRNNKDSICHRRNDSEEPPRERPPRVVEVLRLPALPPPVAATCEMLGPLAPPLGAVQFMMSVYRCGGW